MLQVVLKALSFALCLALGYLLKRIHLLHDQDNRTVSALVMNVTLPCAVIASFQNFKLDFTLFYFFLIALIVNFAGVFWAWFSARNKNDETKAYQIVNYPCYNIGSFTLPFIQTFMSSSCVVATCLFDTANAFVTLGGTYALACNFKEDAPCITVLDFLRQTMSSIPLRVYAVMLILTALNLHLPDVVFTLVAPVAQANAFLSMTMLGLFLDFSLQKDILRKIWSALLCRLSIGLVASLVIWYLAPFSLELKQTCILLLFAPFSSMNPLYTEKIGGDYRASALGNSVSIVVSVIIMVSLLTFWNS